MLVSEDGTRWVLVGEGPAYKAAHDVRKSGKKMTATLAGDAKDIAEAVFYLTEASQVTGEVLHVDGGAHLGRW